MRLILIAAPGERDTDRQIEAACAARGLPCVKVVPGAAGGLDFGPPGERRLFYCTGVSLACITIEQMLFRAGDSALHDPFFHYANQPLIFQRFRIERDGLGGVAAQQVGCCFPSSVLRCVRGFGCGDSRRDEANAETSASERGGALDCRTVPICEAVCQAGDWSGRQMRRRGI
jgi:hypothetical protein